jgi:hypothetical protein
MTPDPVPAAGISDGPPGDAVHDSPGLAELFAGLDPDRDHRVLDLGPAVACNLEHYRRVASRVRFVDLLRVDPREDLRGLEGDELERRLAELLPGDGDGPDLILTWDVLNYFDDRRAGPVARRVAALAAPGARLHTMIITAPTMSAEPNRYLIVAPGRLAYRTGSARLVPAPGLPPARVERWLEPLAVTRSVVLRHGVRELVAVRA